MCVYTAKGDKLVRFDPQKYFCLYDIGYEIKFIYVMHIGGFFLFYSPLEYVFSIHRAKPKWSECKVCEYLSVSVECTVLMCNWIETRQNNIKSNKGMVVAVEFLVHWKGNNGTLRPFTVRPRFYIKFCTERPTYWKFLIMLI